MRNLITLNILGYPALGFGLQIPIPEPNLCLLVLLFGLLQDGGNLGQGNIGCDGFSGLVVP